MANVSWIRDLHWAVLENDEASFNHHIQTQSVLCTEFPDEARQCYPMHTAARLGRLDMARRMVEFGANVNIESMDPLKRETPLEVAIQSKQLEMARYLLEVGGTVPTFKAAEKGEVDEIKFALKAGAPIDAQDETSDMETALHKATLEDHLEVVQYLLEAKATPNIKSTFGVTALHLAAEDGKLEIAKCLLEAGADVEGGEAVEGEAITPLQRAAEEGNTELVECLLEAGAKPDIKDPEGVTALGLAERKGHTEVAALLRG